MRNTEPTHIAESPLLLALQAPNPAAHSAKDDQGRESLANERGGRKAPHPAPSSNVAATSQRKEGQEVDCKKYSRRVRPANAPTAV